MPCSVSERLTWPVVPVEVPFDSIASRASPSYLSQQQAKIPIVLKAPFDTFRRPSDCLSGRMMILPNHPSYSE